MASKWQELALVYARIGATSFGGPQVQIAMQHEAIVEKRQWLSEADFWAGVALFEVLPGPSGTQTGIYVGFQQGGWLGALVTGLSFILPAFVIEVILSWAYFRWQGLPGVTAAFVGMSPVVIAILLAFCWRLGQKVFKGLTPLSGAVQALIAIATLLLALRNVNVLLLMLLAGLINLGRSRFLSLAWPGISGMMAQVSPAVLSLASVWDWSRVETYAWPLFSFFVKTGSVVVGGGYVIIPFIEAEVVEQLRWLTPQEFLDGVAIGQLSPGPIVLTAAFIGYKVAGVAGAAIATIAIFLPSFVFVGLGTPLMNLVKTRAWVKTFLQGVLPAVLGLVAAATVRLAVNVWHHDSLMLTLIAIAITAVSLVATVRFRIPPWQLVLGGMVVGLSLDSLR